MKKLSLLAFLPLCFACKTAQTASNLPKDTVTLESTARILSDLSSDEMAGRKPGTPGMEKAIQYIENYLNDAGIEPYFNSSYRDTFQVEGTEAYNLVGLIEADEESDEYILLGAHYDHIGKLESATDSVYNGANDNASGVTAVLEIAQMLNKQELDKNVIVALFSGEESGLVGSKHLARRLKAENIDLEYVINFEMIGETLTAGKDKVYLTGFDMSNFSSEVNQLLEREFITYLPEEEQYKLFYRSDNYPFYEAFQIPAHTISSFDFRNSPYYHHPQDEAKELDVENMHAIIQTSARAIQKLLSEEVAIELKEETKN